MVSPFSQYGLALGSSEVPPRMSKVHMIIKSGHIWIWRFPIYRGYPQIIHCVFGFSIVNHPLIGGTIILGNLHLVNPTSSIFLISPVSSARWSIALHGQGARIESSPREPSLYKSPKAISRDGSEWHQKGLYMFRDDSVIFDLNSMPYDSH